jgi:iron complex transport system substrate-binding protein
MQDMTGDTGDKTGILPWDAPKLKGAKPQLLKYVTSEVPYEQIAALHPDLILAVDSGITTDQYRRLTQIAPTVGYPGKPWLTSWQDQLRLVGEALGKSAQAARLEKSTERLIAHARAKHPEFAGKTVAFGSGTTTSSYNLYLSTDSRVQLLRELGFTVSPSLPAKAPSFAAQVSLEKLDSIDADVLVSWYLSPTVKKQLESDTLFRRMPAVKRGGYVPLTDPAMVYATSAVSVLSLPWMLDRYLPLLSAAAKGKAS